MRIKGILGEIICVGYFLILLECYNIVSEICVEFLCCDFIGKLILLRYVKDLLIDY